jgi:hypothetical protein
MAKTWIQRAVLLGLAAAVCLCAAPSPLHADGVTVALLPNGTTVTPGSEFDLVLQCTQAGDLFNGFDALVSWDPAALTFLPLTPTTLQQGLAMTGACGNTFHDFHAGADTDTITDVLLCNDTFLTGPGQLYKLHFRASSTPQVAVVRLAGVKFYDAGRYVTPVHVSNAVLGIGVPAPVAVGDPPAARLALRAAPNPSRGGLQLAIAADRAGVQRLTVRDLQGRVVRRLAEGWRAAGARYESWDGRDEAGARLPAGIYLLTLDAGGRTTTQRVTLLP